MLIFQILFLIGVFPFFIFVNIFILGFLTEMAKALRILP